MLAPEVLLGEQDEPSLDRVPDGGDDASDPVRCGVLVDELVDDPGQPLAEQHQGVEVLRLGHVAGEVDGIGSLEPHEVRAGHHPEWVGRPR